MEKNYILAVRSTSGHEQGRVGQAAAPPERRNELRALLHPDGRRIVFASNMDDWPRHQQFGHNFELYLINLDGTGLERLTFNACSTPSPCSRPMQKLVWASNRDRRNAPDRHLHRGLGGVGARRVVPAWTRDG